MPARSPLAQALREARQAAGLTQAELGQQLGLNGRAIYRWERDENTPSEANQRRVLQVIASLHEAAGTKLRAAIAEAEQVAAPPAPAQPPTPPALAPRAMVESAVFTLADELDLPARRVRGALARWLRRVQETGLALDVIQRELDAWIDSAR